MINHGAATPGAHPGASRIAARPALYHYTEYPAIYHKDRVVGHIRAARAGETPEQARERGDQGFMALQASPFFGIWACAGVDEILSALHERVLLGSLA